MLILESRSEQREIRATDNTNQIETHCNERKKKKKKRNSLDRTPTDLLNLNVTRQVNDDDNGRWQHVIPQFQKRREF